MLDRREGPRYVSELFYKNLAVAASTECASERNKFLKPTETELFFLWGKVDNFWQDFFQMSAFLSSNIFCPLVPPLARCLKFKGRRKWMLLIWSYVLKSFKIYQLFPTSRYYSYLSLYSIFNNLVCHHTLFLTTINKYCSHCLNDYSYYSYCSILHYFYHFICIIIIILINIIINNKNSVTIASTSHIVLLNCLCIEVYSNTPIPKIFNLVTRCCSPLAS